MQTKKTGLVKNILLNLSDYLDVKGIQGVADFLEVRPTKLYGWIRNGKIADPWLILTKLPDINPQWLESGDGPMIIEHSTTKNLTINGDQNIQSGRNTSGGNVQVHGRAQENLTLTTDEQFLINTLRKLPNYEDVLADLNFQVMQKQRESKNTNK